MVDPVSAHVCDAAHPMETCPACQGDRVESATRNMAYQDALAAEQAARDALCEAAKRRVTAQQALRLPPRSNRQVEGEG